MAERAGGKGGKVEAAIAAAILVIVTVLFVKYYEPASTVAPDPTANGKPGTVEKTVQ